MSLCHALEGAMAGGAVRLPTGEFAGPGNPAGRRVVVVRERLPVASRRRDGAQRQPATTGGVDDRTLNARLVSPLSQPGATVAICRTQLLLSVSTAPLS